MKQTLILTLLILFFVISCAAQSNSKKSVSAPKAQRLDVIPCSDGTELSMRRAPLIKALRKKPTTKAYIIIYPSADYMAENARALLNFARLRFDRSKITLSRIILLEGGIRKDEGCGLITELFIVPKGAVPPLPTPIVDDKRIPLKP